ncbi:phosphoribosyltransferase [Thalassoporum mexicanum PCC 7367]|uniref:phosphoribosyltransferase n=1 Tax=Thalassoporum mexicanum TaxID=3457544 RepID=UPI00029F9FD4|nr:phosphoribosyltransferase family protein [Pseudanabaena sp. PCC 7367]AFY70981.1 phosphoribosyltransferase [Pseudanabaena sp. PCC 7367]
MTEEIRVSWSEYHQKIELLAAIVYRSGWHFDQILCLARGGLRAGDIFSRIYEKPLAILSASSYGGDGGRSRHQLTIAQSISMTTASLGANILLVDDLADSGITLQETVAWLENSDRYVVNEVKTAVVWYKAQSIFKPDFYVDYLPDSPWVRQPFEVYDRMTLAELDQQVPKVRSR